MHRFLTTITILITSITCLSSDHRAHIRIERDFSYTPLHETYVRSLPNGWDIFADQLNEYDLRLTMPDGREITFESYLDENDREIFHVTVDEQLVCMCNYKGTRRGALVNMIIDGPSSRPGLRFAETPVSNCATFI
jgi:hypothetical protein